MTVTAIETARPDALPDRPPEPQAVGTFRHGWYDGSATAPPVLAARRITASDMPGHGASPHPDLHERGGSHRRTTTARHLR